MLVMSGRAIHETAPRTEVAGIKRTINKGVASHITPQNFATYTGHGIRSWGRQFVITPQISRELNVPPFTADVSLSIQQDADLKPLREGAQNGVLDGIVSRAEKTRAGETADREAGLRTWDRTYAAMEAVADVTAGNQKIYLVTPDGVGMNLSPAQLISVGLGHALRGVNIDFGAVLGLPSPQAPKGTPALPAPSAPDRGIAVEPVGFNRAEIQPYLAAIAQFRGAFGEDPVAMINRVFAEPYGKGQGESNYDRLLALMEHAAMIVAYSANPNAKLGRSQSIMEGQLEASVAQSNFWRQATAEVAGGVLKVASGEAARRKHRSAGLLNAASRGAQHTTVEDVPAEDDLLEIAAVGALKHAWGIVTSQAQDPRMQKWQGEVREVLKWVFGEVDQRLQIPGANSHGEIMETLNMNQAATDPLHTYNALRRALA